jgi:hypothetical protein
MLCHFMIVQVITHHNKLIKDGSTEHAQGVLRKRAREALKLVILFIIMLQTSIPMVWFVNKFRWSNPRSYHYWCDISTFIYRLYFDPSGDRVVDQPTSMLGLLLLTRAGRRTVRQTDRSPVWKGGSSEGTVHLVGKIDFTFHQRFQLRLEATPAPIQRWQNNNLIFNIGRICVENWEYQFQPR